ncbi:aminodeoxychorismate lyase [Arenimonas composti]|uniref:Aminodeoxychorismate lyase n=1 Tax=Arenimonas composti TR7-09 = DSM 18010 TaxID=1121013 RepID=A0A091BG12_9GAMM|nr:aminodeoxychorismate lyase [Arenimonas composti]KFN50432.1 hypothetical protein P873_07150 [Arenimonas composti TR7-09 = DSM 18010]
MTALASRIYSGHAPLAALGPGERALAYGDGLFTTARVHAGRVVWREAHLRRLQEGAARLGFAAPDAGFLDAAIDELLAAAPADAVLKLILGRGAGGRGYAPDPGAEPTLVLALFPPPPPPPPALALRWCALRLAAQPALAGIKHLNRLEQVLARAEWSAPGIHEGLLRDAAGDVICATAANVFARIDGRWRTPPVNACGVAGIARAWVRENADVEIAPLSPAALEAADAVFLCNAVRGILPVGSLAGRRWTAHPALLDLRRTLARAEPAFA